MDVKGNEEKILPFVSDHKLNVFDFHEYDNFEQFHSELGLVFEFLRYSEDRRKLEEKLEKKQEEYKKLSRQAKILLTKLTNIKKIPDVSEEKFRKGDFDMCKAFEDMEEKERAEGIIETALEFGASEEKIQEKLQDKLQIPLEKAKEYLRDYIARG